MNKKQAIMFRKTSTPSHLQSMTTGSSSSSLIYDNYNTKYSAELYYIVNTAQYH